MKKELVIWMMLVMMCIHSSWAVQTTIRLDVGVAPSPATYSTTLQSIRNATRDPNRSFFGIPMLPRPSNPLTYIRVEIQSYVFENLLTLALDRRNLCIVGYSDQFNNGNAIRAFFFNDAPPNAITTAFPYVIAANRKILKFGSSYQQLESKAGSRVSLGLGSSLLGKLLNQIYGVAVPNEKLQAEFLLIATQIVSEAARFKYVEAQVNANFNSYKFTPNPKVISLPSEWGNISTGIRKAPPATGILNPALHITDANNKPVSVTKINNIAFDMGILKYVA